MSANATDDPFITGLKKIIKIEWETQEEFAKGVTSKVNMSNILRGAVGTSQKMRDALATKAGLTVEEVVDLGRKTLRSGIMPSRPAIQPSEMHELTGSEIHGRIHECSRALQEEFNFYHTAMTNAVTGLVQERDDLISLVHQERATLNAISDRVKVVDADLNIIACNRACTEKYMQVIGDKCEVAGRKMCEGSCIAKKAFRSGKVERKLSVDGDAVETCAAYPMVDPDGTVGRVTVVTGSLSDFMEAFKEQGLKIVRTK